MYTGMNVEYKRDAFGRVWYWIDGQKGYLISPAVWTEEEAREDYKKFNPSRQEPKG